MLKDASGRAGHGLHSGSAPTDLAVGLAYVYAGRGYMALDPLLAAIAQLEVRASLHSLRQAYAATAFAYAQTGNSVQATVYLDRARSADGAARFAVRSSADFCMDMASRWLGDPEAKDRLVRSAEEHYRARPVHPGRHLHARRDGQRHHQGFPVHGGDRGAAAGAARGAVPDHRRRQPQEGRRHHAGSRRAGRGHGTRRRPGQVRRPRLRLRQGRGSEREGQRRPRHPGEPRGFRAGAAHHAPEQGAAAHRPGAPDSHPRGQRGLQQGHRPGHRHFRADRGRTPVPGVHQAGSFFAK